MEKSVTLEMIQEAREALKGVAEVTPVVTSKRLGTNLYIKSENLQKTGSFKIRGAYNKIRNLTPEEASRGVIACSAGNHAQGVALSATRLGIKSVICMPEGAPILKVEATRGYGAEVVLVPGIYDDAAREQREEGTCVAAFCIRLGLLTAVGFPLRIPSMTRMSLRDREPSAWRSWSRCRMWNRSSSPSEAAD